MLRNAVLELNPSKISEAVKRENNVNELIFVANEGKQTSLQFICYSLAHRGVVHDMKDDDFSSDLHLKVMQALIDLKAYVNSADATILKDTPLIYAVDAGHTQAVNLLLKAGAQQSIDSADCIYRNTPLLIALKRNYSDIAMLLSEYKPNVNLADKSGNTPLHYACLYRDKKMINRLLAMGAKPSLANCDGITPGDLYLFDLQNFHWIGSDRGQLCSLFQMVEEFFTDLDLNKRPCRDLDVAQNLMGDKTLVPSDHMLKMGEKLHANFYKNHFWLQFLQLAGLVELRNDVLLYSLPGLKGHWELWKMEDHKPKMQDESKKCEGFRREAGQELKILFEKETAKFHSLSYYKISLNSIPNILRFQFSNEGSVSVVPNNVGARDSFSFSFN